ncbi:hypothetical protein V6N13_057133 [Hibiscus sabdariffa]
MPRLKSKPKSKFKLKKVPKLKLKSMPKPVWNREHQLKELPSLTNVGSVPLEHLLGASHSMHLGCGIADLRAVVLSTKIIPALRPSLMC